MRSGSTGEPLDVVDLPAGEMRAGYGPVFARTVRCENKGALLGTHEDTDCRHIGLRLCGSIQIPTYFAYTLRATFGSAVP